MSESIVIVGASLAGAKAAQTLREEGFTGDIVLIGAETELPYERPPLSKGLLLGKGKREKIYVHPAEWYAENRVDLRLGTLVTSIDRAAHTVTTDAGDQIGYSKLLLTTGASPRHLPLPGDEHPNVLYLRTLADSDRIAAALEPGKRIVLIGAGWIGLEIASAARAREVHVSIVETAPLPLLAVLGDKVAQIFADLHREHGVEFHFGARLERLTENSVILADGTELPADVVIVGIGAQANVQLAADSGLDVDNGVLVDADHRTADPDVFAAGDVANAYSPVFEQHIRTEHWANALNGGPEAARAMLGLPVDQTRVPFFFTDQYDLGAEYAGYAKPDETEVVFRGDVAKRKFIAFWTRDGRVQAGMNVNVWSVTSKIQALIKSGRQIDPARLADPDIPLDEL